MTIFHPTSTFSSNNSFRLEIGNISNRCEPPQLTATMSVKDNVAVLAVEVVAPVVSQVSLVGEGNWLKDYVDSLSRVMSFRGSGRFFT
ncbi:hypothetical protein MTR_7g052370 [Medicago truncatula]|uniref:Uncharacterized protein n=1 Tax=Medicago truncatula TaxID=3880 RepID=G7KY32_MEDTR|nr:hypothetical protein MTR_7g052370 [Medicago truncatula]